MSLQVISKRSMVSKKSISAFFAVLALLVQPIVSLNIPAAFAATVTDRVVINEIQANPLPGEKEWVELYNPTTSTVSLAGWVLTYNNGGAIYPITSVSEIAAGGFAVVEAPDSVSYLDNTSDSLTLRSTVGQVDAVSYSNGIPQKSFARTYDASTDFNNQASPTKGATNGIAPDTTGPIVEVTYPTNGSVITSTNNKITVKGNFSDDLSGANYIQTQLVYKGNDMGIQTKYGQITDGVFAEFDTTNLIDGPEYYIAVTGTDIAGNVSERKIVNFTLDKTAPDAPALSMQTSSGQNLTNNGFTNKYNVVANWSMPNGNPTSYVYTYWNDIVGNQYKSDSPYSVTLSGLQQAGAFTEGEGKHYIQVFAVDAVGNAQGSNIFGITYDKTNPIVSSFTYGTNNTPAENATLGGTVTFNIGITEANPGKVYIEYMEKDTGGTWRKKIGREVRGSDLAQLTVNTKDYQDGEHQIKISGIVDKAGNIGATKTYRFTVDNTPPSVSFTRPSAGGLFGKDRVVNIQGTIGDGVRYQLFINDELKDDNTGAFTEGGFDWSTSGIESNTYVIKVIAYDSIGNATTVNNTVSVNVDTIEPNVTITSTTANDNDTYTILGTTDDNTSSVQIVTTSSRGVIATQNVTPISNIWSITTPVLQAGQYTVLASSQDAAGNKSVQGMDNTRQITVLNSVGGSGSGAMINFNSLAPITPVSTLASSSVTNRAITQDSDSADNTAISSEDTDGEVLGTQDSKKNVAVIEPSERGWMLLGLAWYWWLLILAAIAFALWGAAKYRKRANDQTL